MGDRDHSDLGDAADKLLRALEDEPKGDKIKQVIVYRRDLKMRKGKIAAQVSHASMKVFFDRQITGLDSTIRERISGDPHSFLVVPLDEPMGAWVRGIFTKIVLTVDNEDDLLRAYQMAQDAGLPCSLCTDAGITEFRDLCPDCAKPLGNTGMIIQQPIACLTCGGKGTVPRPTNTAIAIGPAPASEIDKITGPEGAVKTRLP